MTEILTKCADYLKSEGFRIVAEKESHLIFKCQGKTYAIENDLKDEAFLRFVLPNFYHIDGEEEEVKALKIINRILHEKKAIKLSFDSDKDMWGTVELFLDKNTSLPPIIDRCLDLIGDFSSRFAYEMER